MSKKLNWARVARDEGVRRREREMDEIALRQEQGRRRLPRAILKQPSPPVSHFGHTLCRGQD